MSCIVAAFTPKHPTQQNSLVESIGALGVNTSTI
jgi:hypothetical protein